MTATTKRKPKPIEITLPTAANARQAIMDFFAFLEENPELKIEAMYFKAFHLPGVKADKWKVRFKSQ